MRTATLAAVLGCSFLIAAAASGEVKPQPPSIAPAPAVLPEPTLETPTMPAPGWESVQKRPFEPYDIGPPEHAWRYEALSADERAAVDRGRAAGESKRGTPEMFTAIREHSARARAQAAQHQLGVDALETIGVVP
jgi:hypothetical protein